MKKLFFVLLFINLYAQDYNFDPANDYERIEYSIEQEYSDELQEKEVETNVIQDENEEKELNAISEKLDDNTYRYKYFYDNNNLKKVVIYTLKDNIFYKKNVKEYDYDEKITSDTTYINGKKEGIEKIFFPNGNISRLYKYSNNKKNGITKAFFDDGELALEILFENNLAVSGVFYDKNGSTTKLDKSHFKKFKLPYKE